MVWNAAYVVLLYAYQFHRVREHVISAKAAEWFGVIYYVGTHKQTRTHTITHTINQTHTSIKHTHQSNTHRNPHPFVCLLLVSFLVNYGLGCRLPLTLA